MSTMRHPTVQNVTVEVAASEVEAWVEQGWLEVRPALVAERGPELVSLRRKKK